MSTAEQYPEAESLTAWIARTGTTATVADADTNPNIDPAEWSRDASHWTVTLHNAAGRTLPVPFSQGSALTEPPTAADVLACLVSDIPEDGATFEDWANEYGYDTDSRRAERTFHAVERQTLALRKWAGTDFESLRDVDTDR